MFGLLNKNMNLEQIRQKTAYIPNSLPDLKTQTRDWLRGIHKEFPIALTLTLKQSYAIKNNHGIYYKKIDEEDCHRIAKNFTYKLNQQVFGSRGAKKYKKALKYLIAVEGMRSNKHLHLHMAIGHWPEHIKWNQIKALVDNAKIRVCEINEQSDLSIADSGWNEYIVKELSKSNTDSILWDLI